MNSSTSTPSPAWPTHWPKDSFRAWPTIGFIAYLFALSFVIIAVGVVYFLAKYSSETGGQSLPIVPAIIFQIVLEGAIVASILLALPWLTKFTWSELGFRLPTPANVGFALLGTLAMVVIVEGGASLIQTLMHTKHEQQVVQLFQQLRGSGTTMWFFAFFAVVLAPFMEEAIFRIFLFNIGLRYWGFWAGAIISGALFGAAHIDAATGVSFLTTSVPLIFGGIILAFVYYRTRNAFASMITHGTFNLLTVIAILYFPQLAK